MKVPSLLLASLFMLAISLASAAEPLSAADQVAQMKRGVNIVGYDPIWQDPAKGRFKPRHFKIIKDGGFDTVRINLYGFRQMNEQLVLESRLVQDTRRPGRRSARAGSQRRPRRARLRALPRRHGALPPAGAGVLEPGGRALQERP